MRRAVDLIFFKCYLAFPQSILGNYQVDSLTNPISITDCNNFDPKVNESLVTRLAHYKPSGDHRVEIVENAVVDIGLVRLSLWEWETVERKRKK